MCGFVTVVATGSVTSSTLRDMTTKLVHRGPDDVGYACVDPVTGQSRSWSHDESVERLSGILFGFRRLSILDLTTGGHQPMYSDDGSMVLVFNGEIYNFVELREELKSAGIRFRSRSDTEVLLKAYEYWGSSALEKFNGMWAFAIWDNRSKTLIVSRDRFGVKPLYYTMVDGAWIFASEIKAILAFPGAFRGFHARNVRRFVEQTQVDCGEETLFTEIFALPPGTRLELSNGRLTRHRYWSLCIDDRYAGKNEGALVVQFADLLSDSVRLRVRSDVPIGTMLSGGLDSTSITALIHEQRERGDQLAPSQEIQGLRSFHHAITACWPGWTHNEEGQVDALCAAYGLTSHKVYPSAETMLDVLGTVIYHLDEPFENPTALIQYLLMRKARELGVTVVLNGHGSDEVLAGYPDHFIAPFLASKLLAGNAVGFLRNAALFHRTGEWTVSQVFDNVAKGFKRGRHNEYASQSDSGRQEHGRDAGLNEDLTGYWYQRRHAWKMSGSPSLLTSALWRAFSTFILPKWLRMEDRVSMACSVESRLPFMDYRLVEFAFNLPDDLKLRDGYTKFILRKAMKTRLPNPITGDRTKKRFASPFRQWFHREWKPIAENTLLGNGLQLRSYMDTVAFQRQLQAFLGGQQGAISEFKIWRALSTEIWLQTFSSGN